MKRQFLTLFLTLIILISIGGAVSIVGAESHVHPGQVSESPVLAAASYPVTGDAQTSVDHYEGLPSETTQSPTLSPTATSASSSSSSSHHLTMTAIDVGRGDALLIEFPNGKTMLVDGGGAYSAQHFVIPYLLQKKITHLDAIVATHEHWDHIDGLIEVLKDGRISVDTAYDHGFPMVRDLKHANKPERDSIHAYHALVKQKSITHKIVTAGDAINVGRSHDPQKDATIYVLSPSHALTNRLKHDVHDKKGQSNHHAINENSLVLRIGYKKVHFLLTGDTGLPTGINADYSMMNDPVQGKHLRADVLKLGHHGFGKPDKKFYDEVKPQYVIMTYGPKLGPELQFGKQQCENLGAGVGKLQYFKGKLWSTCDKGNIVVTTTGSKESIHISSKLGNVPGGCCCNCCCGCLCNGAACSNCKNKMDCSCMKKK